jgi:hypothetical protein
MRYIICETHFGLVNQIPENNSSTRVPHLKITILDTGQEGLKKSQKYIVWEGAVWQPPPRYQHPPQKDLPSTASECPILHSETFMFAQTKIYHQVKVTKSYKDTSRHQVRSFKVYTTINVSFRVKFTMNTKVVTLLYP